MSITSKTFSAVGETQGILVPPGENAHYNVTAGLTGTVKAQISKNAVDYTDIASATDKGLSGTYFNDTNSDVYLRVAVTAYTSGTPVATVQNGSKVADLAEIAKVIGVPVAQTGVLAAVAFNPDTKHFLLEFTLTNAPVTHTDAGASGSSGSLKLFQFNKCVLEILGAKQDLAFLCDEAITTADGDLAFIHSLGSVAANAADKALTGTEADIAAASGDVTCSSNEATSKVIKAVNTPIDGETTAPALYFNESGSAATSDANGTIYVTGKITVQGVML